MSCCGNILLTLAHGTVGLTRYALQVDRLPYAQKAARLDVCRACAHAICVTDGGRVHPRTCTRCHCYLPAKAGDAREQCDRWPV